MMLTPEGWGEITPQLERWLAAHHDPSFVPGRRRYRRDAKGRFTK